MNTFLAKNFMLSCKTADFLYQEHAKELPVIDFHSHLSPQRIAEDYRFKNLTELWLADDHYKWRAMRANGVAEAFCTGEASDWDKFEKWAETVPYTMRNPLYHWTHLELRTAFGIEKLLQPETAKEIYEECTAKLQTQAYSTRSLLKNYRVEVVCTTDDPADSLRHHLALKEEGFSIQVLPTWRPDRAMAVENPKEYRTYVEKLAEVSGTTISTYSDLIEALRKRHDFFAHCGCKLSDHGIEEFYADEFTLSEVERIFNKVLGGRALSREEVILFKSAMLYEGAVMDWEKGWTQQFHYGAMRNNNTRLYKQLGADIGCDSIGDYRVARAMSRFFNKLDAEGKLTKTIVYNLHPADNEMVASLLGSFQEGSVAGKMQLGAGWWFLDQQIGIEAQLNTLSNLGLLSRFVGMLTDSRSFLSFSRHEYFRRILCNLIGTDVEKGLLPASELGFIGKLVENISYYNAKNYFCFQE